MNLPLQFKPLYSWDKLQDQCLVLVTGCCRSFSVFQRSFRWYQTVQKNMYDLRIRLVFLQQLRQTQKDNILKPKLNNPLCSNYHPSDFVRNLLIVNLDVLDLF